METIKNFSTLEIPDGELVALCHAEEFAGENPVHFDTIIEDFDQNIDAVFVRTGGGTSIYFF